MALLNRMDWYDIARTTNWTAKYVEEGELYPDEMSGSLGIPMEQWEVYDEPYKQTYPEYVKVQREKDAGAYSVKAALERSKMYERADPGWLSVMKAHYGAINYMIGDKRSFHNIRKGDALNHNTCGSFT